MEIIHKFLEIVGFLSICSFIALATIYALHRNDTSIEESEYDDIGENDDEV